MKGVVDYLIPGVVTHLYYVDDTLLLFEPNLHSIATVKALLRSFELMSARKINFLKCEMTMGLGITESKRVVDH